MFGFFKKKQKWLRQSDFIGTPIDPKYQEQLTRIIDAIKSDSSSYEERKHAVLIAYIAAKDWLENGEKLGFPDFEQHICNATRGYLWDHRLPVDRRKTPRDGETAKKAVMNVVQDFDRVWYQDYPDVNGVVVVDRDGKALTKEDLIKMGWWIPDGGSLTSQEFAQQVRTDTLARRASDLPKVVSGPSKNTSQGIRDTPTVFSALGNQSIRSARGMGTPGKPLSEYTEEEIDAIVNASTSSELALLAVKEEFEKFKAYLLKRPVREVMDGSPGQTQYYVNRYFLHEYIDVKLEDIDRELKKGTKDEQPA